MADPLLINKQVILKVPGTGIFYGKYVWASDDGIQVRLEGARQIGHLAGNADLEDSANHGVRSGDSKISQAVSSVTYIGVSMVLPCTAKSSTSIDSKAAWNAQA